MKNTILGVLGGMGPGATVDFLQKIVDLTDASKDQEHLRVVTDSHPQIPDRTQAILENSKSPVPLMQESLDNLLKCGAKIIAMPCNTAHYFLPYLKIPQGILFLNMPELAAAVCKSRFGDKTVGLLATAGTVKSGVVAAALDKAGVLYCLPSKEDQDLLGRLILDVKAKKDMGQIAADFNSIAARMTKASGFLLACTELPLIVQFCNFPYAYVDATLELARAAVEMISGKNN